MVDVVDIFKITKIPTYTPGDREYEIAVATSNLLYRFSRPPYVVQPKTYFHVRKIVTFAKEQKLGITIKNGGHSYAGFSTTNKRILLDLSSLNEVELELDTNKKPETVTLQGGALWGHAYKELINGHHDGYIINGGRCPWVGVSGFVLGGGLSPFTRSFGMACDTLKEAKIVTADGKLVTVNGSDKADPDNRSLFWALCGAGGGNFGVVVELTMEVQKLRYTDVVAGIYTWSPDLEPQPEPKDESLKPQPQLKGEFLNTMNDFYTANWPNEMTIDSSWVCDLQQKKEGKLAVRFIVYFNGKKIEFDDQINKFIKDKALAEQLKRRTQKEKSTRFLHETLVAQWSEETKRAIPTNKSYYLYTSFVFEKNEEMIDKVPKITTTIEKNMSHFRCKFQKEEVLLQVTFIHSGGKASEKDPAATAFHWRKGVYHAYIMVQWDDKWMERDMRIFFEDFKKELKIYSILEQAAYINFPDRSLGDYEKAYYGDNRQELQRIKQVWDKGNFFSWKQSVKLPQVVRENTSVNESMGDEGDLTDQIAAEQWDTYNPPPMNDYLGFQGIQGLPFF